MIETLSGISSWGELAILIPLITILIYKPKGRENRPLVLYVIVASVVNFLIVGLAKAEGQFSFLPLKNHFLYNIHSFIKILLLGWYINSFSSLKAKYLIKPCVFAFILFAIFNFLFLEPISEFSVRIANIESILLLVFCSVFFLSTILDNSETIWMHHPAFKVCAGMNFYAAMSFFVFLFFNHLNVTEIKIHNFYSIMLFIFTMSYFIFCIILAMALKNKKMPVNYNSMNPEGYEPI